MIFDMTPECIAEYWKSHAEPPEKSLARWNKSADNYKKKALPTEENSMAMRTMREKGIFDMGGTALDVGCGTGRFSFALEKKGFEVIGTDFAPRMIEECEKKKAELHSHAAFVQANWHTADIAAMGWEKKFDFVLCHMTPAICDASTFLKLSQAARKAVLMLRPCRWVYSFERELMRKFHIPVRINEVDKAMAYAFDLVWLQSGAPETSFEQQTWNTEMSAEDAKMDYIARLSKVRKLSDEEEQYICSEIDKRSEDGIFTDQIRTQIFSMFYRVDGPDYYI